MQFYSQTHLKLTDKQYSVFRQLFSKEDKGSDFEKYLEKVIAMRGASSWTIQKAIADYITGDPWRTRVPFDESHKPNLSSILNTSLLWLWIEGRSWWFSFLGVLIISNLMLSYFSRPKEAWIAILTGSWLILGLLAIAFTLANLLKFLPIEKETIRIDLEE